MQRGWGNTLRSVGAPTAQTPQGGAWDSESLTGEQTIAAASKVGLCIMSLSGCYSENPPIFALSSCKILCIHEMRMISFHPLTTMWAKYSYAHFIGEKTDFVESGF